MHSVTWRHVLDGAAATRPLRGLDTLSTDAPRALSIIVHGPPHPFHGPMTVTTAKEDSPSPSAWMRSARKTCSVRCKSYRTPMAWASTLPPWLQPGSRWRRKTTSTLRPACTCRPCSPGAPRPTRKNGPATNAAAHQAQQLGSEDAAAPARAIRRLVGTGQTERCRPVTWNRAGYGGGRGHMPCPPWLPSTHPPAFLHPTRPVRP